MRWPCTIFCEDTMSKTNGAIGDAMLSTRHQVSKSRRRIMLRRTSTASFLKYVVLTSLMVLSCRDASLAAESGASKVLASSGPDQEAKQLDPSVAELTSVAFSTTIGDGNVWLLEFYSPS